MKRNIIIPVTKIAGILTIVDGFCASVYVTQLTKRYNQNHDLSNAEKLIMNIGSHALRTCASMYFISKGVEMFSSKDGDITIPIGKSDKIEYAEMDHKRTAEIKNALGIDKYIQGLINSYGDAVYAGVNSLQENSDGTIFDSGEYPIASHPVSKYADWKEFIDVLNDYHQLMCKQNDGWNFENTCNELKKTIQWYWDRAGVNKK